MILKWANEPQVINVD